MKKLTVLLTVIIFNISCSHVFYQPSPKTYFNPKKFGYSHQEVPFESRDGTPLNGWFFPADSTKPIKGTIVQFHGNAENISTHFLSLAWITRHGYNLFIFDYQGYGKSKGSPSQERLNEDGIAAIRHASFNYDNNDEDHKLILWGQSLGGAVLMRALHEIRNEIEVSGVVIESSFSSYQDLAREKLASTFLSWFFQPLAYLLVSDSYAPEGKIGELAPVPMLVIHGRLDKIISFDQGMKVFDEAGHPKDFLPIPEGNHINSTQVSDGKYRPTILNHLDGFK